jgi:alkylated DNA repair protein (DNA oxidative demethylase)
MRNESAMTMSFVRAMKRRSGNLELGPDAAVLCGFALPSREHLLTDLEAVIVVEAPFRNMVTPGGHEMSVAMSNCGHLGWISDRKGYRYERTDPLTKHLWPRMPDSFGNLALRAAAAAGFADFQPDACLINRYVPGAKLSLHQDRNERDFSNPIVSVSLGLSATFLFGGMERSDKTKRIQVQHGDVVVWGGTARLRYHGVQPLKQGWHRALGSVRVNLTFRKAG